ncbi:nucleoside monophosphate kinase [Candidatus Nomurabacteria bacterium]|nr:nucleoside monophosphate kinase [Candidatus Nomurabacteria bacterium]
MIENKKAFIFIGPSGSGKGTQLDLLETYLKEKDHREILRYEAGASLREFAKGDSFMAKKVHHTINVEGGLLPRFIMVWNWGRRLALELKEDMNLILEGSPRKVEEKKLIDDALQYADYKDIYVIHLNLSDDVAVGRLMSRGRIDDQEEKIRNRLKWFREEVAQTVEEFKNDDRYIYCEIDGDQSIEKVQEDIIKALGV